MLPLALLALLPVMEAFILPRTIDSPAIKDATILESTSLTCFSCPSSSCAKCTLGHNNTFLAINPYPFPSVSSPSGSDPNSNGTAVSLVGFQLTVPAASVRSCHVQFPAFKSLPQTPLDIVFEEVPASAYGWDESTIDGENAPEHGSVITTVHVDALENMPAVDLTSACQGAGSDGQFSVYFSSAEEGSFEIWSIESGNPAILHVEQ